MPYFLVEINIRSGEYENKISSLVLADNNENAENAGLYSKLHHTDNGAEWIKSEYGIQVYDKYGEDCLSVHRTTELSDEHAAVLKQYLPLTEYNEDELEQCGNFFELENATSSSMKP